jgi:hypothetical protein
MGKIDEILRRVQRAEARMPAGDVDSCCLWPQLVDSPFFLESSPDAILREDRSLQFPPELPPPSFYSDLVGLNPPRPDRSKARSSKSATSDESISSIDVSWANGRLLHAPTTDVLRCLTESSGDHRHAAPHHRQPDQSHPEERHHTKPQVAEGAPRGRQPGPAVAPTARGGQVLRQHGAQQLLHALQGHHAREGPLHQGAAEEFRDLPAPRAQEAPGQRGRARRRRGLGNRRPVRSQREDAGS